jgi:hypothetical protein
MAGSNPNPARITAAWWWFMEQLVALEPSDTVNSGIWGNFKPGYHADRNTLLANPAWRRDYSIQLLGDRKGPDDKGAAGDWTFKSAQAGDLRNIRKYGARVRAAFLARDPRLAGWREVLCQADADDAADGFDFQSWTERTPDATHRWHFHFSEIRANTEDYLNKRAMLSVLRGQTYAEWLMEEEGGDMPRAYRVNEGGAVGISNGPSWWGWRDLRTMNAGLAFWGMTVKDLKPISKADFDSGALGEDVSDADPVQLSDEDLAKIVAKIDAAGGDLTAEEVRKIVDEELDEQARAGADNDS